MSTSKNIDKICLAIILCGVMLTILFMNSESLGITKVVDEDSESHSKEVDFTENDLNGEWDIEDATVITLNGDSVSVSGTGVYVSGNNVVISAAGRYVVMGTLDDGYISVDAYDSSKVYVMLDGADIYCSNNAAFRVEVADKVFLTLAEGSDNTLSSGEEYSEEAINDNTGGAIFSHDDLTINGSGSLNVKTDYKHGLDVNDELVITGGTISITCPQDALHVNDSVRICNADITIDAGDDGIHCDTEIKIVSGKILMENCYEGLESPSIDVSGGDITVYPEDDGFNANGGSEGFVMGFGGRFRPDDTFKDEAGTSETESGTEESRPAPPDMQAEASKEGDVDDEEEKPCISISGGTITIINTKGRDADGLDSNGDIYITGGDVRISLSGSGSNSAIDYGSESGGVCEISGGTVIACGGYSMAEQFDSTSGQCSILYNFSDGADDDTEISLIDSAGNKLLSWEVPCSFTSANISCPEMQLGETYTVVIGDMEEEITLEEVSASYGDAESAGFGGHMNFGGMGMRGSKGGRMGTGGSDSSDERGQGSEMTASPEMPSDMSDMPEPPDFSADESGEMHHMMGGGPGGDFNLDNQEEETAVDTRISVFDLSPEETCAVWISVAAIIAAIVIICLYRRRR